MSSSSVSSTIELNNGRRMPSFGLGTWDFDLEVLEEVVIKAFRNGYRHIDCAAVYANEDVIGKAFKRAFEDEKILKREEVFVTSKLWNTCHGHVEDSCRQSLKDLQLDYLDLYLIHWPYCFAYSGGVNLREFKPAIHDDNGRAKLGNVSILETWKEMEKLVDKGLVKAIGISNFFHPMIHDILGKCRIKPSVHQYECNPFFQRKELSDEMKMLNIAVTAYSPLGGSCVKKTIGDERLKKIAQKHNKTVGQVALRWNIERGHVLIVKSQREERLKENIGALDFELDDEDREIIEEMDEGKSVIAGKDVKKFFGFNPYM